MDRCHASSGLLFAVLAGQALSVHAQAQSTEPFPAQFELSSLLPEYGGNGSNGFVLNGIDAGDESGGSVSLAGDVNGDGIDDLIIGASRASPGGHLSGESYVVFGGSGVGAGGAFELSSLNGDNGFVINGKSERGLSGHSVSSAGDVNGDGYDDIIIGTWHADPNGIDPGESYVVFGGMSVGTGGVIELSSLNGSNGFVLNAVDVSDYCGGSVSSAGDVNGDGFDDFLVGAWAADPNGRASGESYVVFGAVDVGASGEIELSSLNGTNGFVINGSEAYDRSGVWISSARDVNGDGFGDLVIGASHFNYYSIGSGESYVIFGSAGVGASGVIELSSLDGSSGFVLKAEAFWGYSNAQVTSAGDVNGDGFDDVFVGIRQYSVYQPIDFRRQYVVFGGPAVGASGEIELSSLNGTSGFALAENDPIDQQYSTISSAGDLNGDGIDDVVIGSPWMNGGEGYVAGECYVVFGASDIGSGGLIELKQLNGADGFVLNGIDERDLCGAAVSGAGDVNNDGIGDLIIGAREGDPNGISRAGESYVVFGRNLAPCDADLNNDGILDNGDIGAFIALFLALDPAVDLNGDGLIDNADIQAFVNLFLEGC